LRDQGAPKVDEQHRAKPLSGWARYPNLRLGPAAPGRRGRIQRGIQRAFVVSGTSTLSTSAIYDWTMKDRNTGWQRMQRHSVWRVLRRMCDRIGRADTPGKPWLWRLKTPVAVTPRPPSSDKSMA
jgi:hypothetical protein